jgi:3-hydroxyacyl-[acyl-carrier-protein] dehydratase
VTGPARPRSGPTVLVGDVALVSGTELTAVAMADVDPAEPLFAGHYPGFPILPGVCVIEYVRRAAWLAPPPGGAGAEFDVIEAARFLGPVRPGDRLRIEVRWAECSDGWRCTARVSAGHGPVATVRLHYPTVRGAP